MYLNLHAHSLYSDGHDTIETMAKVFKAQDHAALILTDHDGILDPITTEIWQKMLNEAETVSDSLDGYPILIGLEIYVPGASSECLLFGYDACRQWLEILEANSNNELRLPTVKNWWKSMVDKNSFALVLCHPSLRCIDSAFYSFMDGYEIMNAGQMWSDDMIERMRLLMPNAKPFKNLDAHSISYIDPEMFPCNEISSETANALFKPYDNEGNMERLIGWIKH